VECARQGIPLQGIFHDWHKFLPSEFIPYYHHFGGEIKRGRDESGYYKADDISVGLVHLSTCKKSRRDQLDRESLWAANGSAKSNARSIRDKSEIRIDEELRLPERGDTSFESREQTPVLEGREASGRQRLCANKAGRASECQQTRVRVRARTEDGNEAGETYRCSEGIGASQERCEDGQPITEFGAANTVSWSGAIGTGHDSILSRLLASVQAKVSCQVCPKCAAEEFDLAWLLHISRARHHWQFWILPRDEDSTGAPTGMKVYEMPLKYRKEMLADWIGAGKAQGTKGVQFWWEKNKGKMILGPETRAWLQDEIDLIMQAEGCGESPLA
jgi:hypothetical protein